MCLFIGDLLYLDQFRLICVMLIKFSFYTAVVTFGFSPASYTVDESVGVVNLGVSFLEGSFGSAPISVRLLLDTTNDTAQGQ